MHGEAQGTETRSATIQMIYRNRKIRYTGESKQNSKKKISDPRKSKENRNEKQREKKNNKIYYGRRKPSPLDVYIKKTETGQAD